MELWGGLNPWSGDQYRSLAAGGATAASSLFNFLHLSSSYGNNFYKSHWATIVGPYFICREPCLYDIFLVWFSTLLNHHGGMGPKTHHFGSTPDWFNLTSLSRTWHCWEWRKQQSNCESIKRKNPLHNFRSFPCNRLRMLSLCLIAMQMAKRQVRPTYKRWYPVAAVQTGRVRDEVREPRET